MLPSVSYDRDNSKKLFENFKFQINENFNISEIENSAAKNLETNLYDLYQTDNYIINTD
jgi:hypothetical protein